MTRSWLLVSVVVAAGCAAPIPPHAPAAMPTGQAGTTPPTATTPPVTTPPMTTVPTTTPGVMPAAALNCKTISEAGALAYLRKLAPMVVERVLSTAERAQITAQKGCAIEPIVTAWTNEPAFIASSRRFLEESLQTSGMIRDVDFNLPGNLAAYVVKNRKPWSEIITSTTCYDANLAPKACDTGAPYTAGILTTRAFIGGRTSRFNLSRASAMLLNFACQHYPMADALQPRVEKTWLMPLFQANSPAEQTDPRGATLANNGFGCYVCHGQFSIHAQLFVKFDGTGIWHPEATGMQDPVGELGRSTGGLMASHLKDPEHAGLEGIQVFGTPVANLADAARVMTQAPTFVDCAAKRYLDYMLGVPDQAIAYDPALFPGLGARIRATNPSPTLQDIVHGLFTDPTVVSSVITAAGGS